MRILIVDDEALIREHLAGLAEWEAQGCTVVGSAANGMEALAMIPETGPELVITDIRMPGMNGIELAGKVRAEFPHLHVMFISAYHDFEYAKQAMKLGVCDFITKPILISEMLDSVALLQQGVLRMNEDERLEQEKLLALLLAEEGGTGEARALVRKQQVENLPVQVAFIEIDNAELLHLSNKPLSLMVLREIVDHRLKNQPRRYWTYLDRNGIAAVFFESVPAVRCPSSDMLTIAKTLVDDVAELTGQSVSVGISRPLPSVAEIRDGIRQSRQCLEYRMLLGKGSVIMFEALAKLGQGRTTGEDRAVIELIGHVRRADREQIDKAVRAIYRNMLASGMNKQVIQQCAADILARTDALIDELHIPADKAKRLDAQKSLFGYSILADLLQFVSAYLHEAACLIASHTGTVTPLLIKRVFDYLEKHCQEDMSLQSLSKHLHINHSYLSRLIKKETGENFRDLLWKSRVIKAKELLRQSEAKTFEIAYESGFKDPSHFSQVFKRYVGVRPSEYRDSQRP